jgi:hypothetical protein
VDYATGHLVPFRCYAFALAESPDVQARAAEAHCVGNLVYGERLVDEQFPSLKAGFISEHHELTVSMFLHKSLATRTHLAQVSFTGGEFRVCDSDELRAKSIVAIRS